MKIIGVEITVSDRPIAHPFVWRAGLPGSGSVAITSVLAIHTDEGITGYAEADRGLIMQDLVDRRLRDLLIGRDPLFKEDIWRRIWELDRIEELPIYALGVVDVALWDLLGKAAGLPVYKLAGGFRNRIPAYASTVTFATTAEFLECADQCLALGYPAIKLHAWGDARRDARLCQDLRKHVGDEIPLMYDGSAGFDLIDAIYLGRALEEAGYLWYEEPMREFSIDAYRRLREKIGIPLLSGETSDGAHYNIADFIAAGAADLVRTSCKFKGGLTGGLRIAHLAEAHQMRAEVHGMGLPNLHLACAIPNTTYYEQLVTHLPVSLEGTGIGPDGHITVPEAPGFGYPEW